MSSPLLPAVRMGSCSVDGVRVRAGLLGCGRACRACGGEGGGSGRRVRRDGSEGGIACDGGSERGCARSDGGGV